MASRTNIGLEYARKKANERAKIIDKEYGEGTYGSTAYREQKEAIRKSSMLEKTSSTKSGGGKTDIGLEYAREKAKQSYSGYASRSADYSSTVKRLSDKGTAGASGIMTESEWKRRKATSGYNTYQDYLNATVKNSVKDAAPISLTPEDDAYWDRRLREEMIKVKQEHPNDYVYPVGRDAVDNVAKERNEYEMLKRRLGTTERANVYSMAEYEEGLSPEEKAYRKYAINKESNIEGINENVTMPDAAFSAYVPEKGFFGKVVDAFGDALPDGTTAKRLYNEATGFKDNSGAWTDDQLAEIAINTLHNSDSMDSRAYAMVDEAYERLSNSPKYKDSDLVAALAEARRSWRASPTKAAAINVAAAGAGMASDIASFANSLGADAIPGVRNLTNSVIKGGKYWSEKAARYNKGAYGESVGNFTQGVVNLVPYMIMGAGNAANKIGLSATKYAKYIEPIIKNPSFYYSLISGWGSKYQEAIDGGASREKAVANAALYAIPAALVEVGGGFGSPDGMEESLLRQIYEEVGEELAQDFIGGLSDKTTTKPDLPWFSTTESAVVNPVDMAKTALMTVPIVAVAGGANKVARKALTSRATKEEYERLGKELKPVASVVINSGLDTFEGTDAYKHAHKLAKKGVEKVSDYELGLQHRYNVEQIGYEIQEETQNAPAKAQESDSKKDGDTSILQRVELLSVNGEQISVEEAQEASGYGENGARVLADSVNSAEGRSFSEIKSEMHNAYLAGRSNKRVNPESFTTDIELKAYVAGRQDGELGRIKLQESRGSVENKVDGEKITLTNTDDNSMIKSRFRNDTDGKIRFNQENIDYENSSYREGSFNLIGQSNGNVETTKGGVVGKYGVHKKSNGYYGVTLLSAGMDIAAFETESEAALFATYANDTIPFNDIAFTRNADGRIVVDTSTAEFMQYGEQINELKDNKPYLQDTMGTFDDDVSFSIESNRKRTRKKKSHYDEYESLALRWARNTNRRAGDLTVLNRNGKQFVLLEATDDGYIELKSGKYKEVYAEYERAYRKATNEIYGNTKGIEAEQGADIWDLQHAGDRGNAGGDGGQIEGEGLQSDTSGSDEHLRNGDKGKSVEDDVSFSIETLPGTDKKYVKADEQVIKSENPDDWEKEIFDYVNKVVRKGNDFIIPIDNEENIVITERTAWKLSDRGKFADEYYLVKGNASGVIDEIISVSKYLRSKPPKKPHPDGFARFGFDYRKAYFMDLDGKYYELQLSVGINDEGREAYNIGQIKEVAIPSKRVKAPKGITTYDFSLSHKDDVVNSSISEKSKNDTKGVVKNEEGRDDTISGSLGRSVGESSGKPSRSIPEATGKVQEDGGARTDTESSRRIYAENVRAVQGTEVRRQGPFQCEFIKPEYYTDDMRAIEEENKAQGLNTYFFFGGGKYKNKFIFRGAISKNDVYIRCDHPKYSPEQINKHEKVHHKYKTKEIEKIRNYIEKRLTKAEKEHIINTMYARYSLACKGNPNKIFEEFVCDVLADMNDYGDVFKDIADAYWNNDTDLIDSYTAADYAESIDAGGNQTLLDNIGIGGEYRLSESGEKYGQTGDNRKGTERIPERVGNQGRGDTSNPENLSDGNSKSTVQNISEKWDGEKRRNTQRSGMESVEVVSQTTSSTFSSSRAEADGKRFLAALRNGDKETARTLLNEQAIKNGFVPANMYHGTLSDDVFTQFESEVGIHWVTPNIDYANGYTEGYYGDDVKAEQLFTEPDSGIYDLYIKPGKVLDVGDTNLNVNALNDIYDFGKRIGFSGEEIKQCWNEGKIYEYKQIWTMVHTSVFANIARERGYDSIRATEEGGVQTYGCLYPENLKSAKLETFDDDGNLIPLEERFNSEDIDLRFSLDEDGEYDLFDIWKSKVEEYGVIPKGEKPARDIDVPKKIAKDKKVSQTVRTILEAKATPDDALPTIEKMALDGAFSYDTYTDKQAIADAEGKLKEDGWLKSYDKWMDDVKKGTVSKQHTVLGWALYNNAVNRATETTSEDERKTAMETALDVLDAMVRHQRSAAQALQATRVLKKLSPETQLYGVKKSVNALQEELVAKYGKKAPELKIDEALAEEFLNAKTEDERLAVEAEIYKDIGRQMPSNWLDKWNAWRYVAMLANPRTHIRNIVGNAAFMPAVAVKDLTATAIESAVNRLSGKKILRNKALITGNKADRALLKAAWNDYGNVADMISNGGKYNDSANPNQHIEEGRQIFKTKPIEWVRKKNSQALEKEDMWFSKPHYAYALAQYCKANNITSEQIAKGKAISLAREYAIREAQKATYRDTNAFSQLVSNVGRNNMSGKNGFEKAVGIAIEGALPFRKTPANILVRGVEYSPLGLLKSLSYDLYKVSKGEISAAEAIDNISAGLTGTGLLVLGVFLAAQGLIRGHGEDEEKEKKFKELMGHQSYSLELKNGQSITLDWLAPEALPFFVGVNIYEATRGSDEEVTMSTILEAVSGITEPMLEMSCLQGINDLIESFGYASSNDTSGLVSILSSTVTSYLTQGIPTIFGQIERTGEKNRMTTYTEKNAFLTSDMQYTLGKISAKIPFLDYNQIPYIDAWGRKEASGMALKRGLNNFLNPAYTSTIETSRMEKELLRLFEKTGEGGVFPSRADKYFKVDGVRKDLTADEYVRYATLKGEKSYKLVSDLVKSNAYKKLSDDEKVKAIEEAYDYANQKAKQTISNYKPDAWVKKADAFGANVGNYISFKTEVSGTKEENGGKISKQEVADIILDMAQNDSETWKMYLSMYDSEKDKYAYNKGIDGETYMYFLEALNDVDEPTESGKYGTYNQKEAQRAVGQLSGLSREEKAVLWQSVNTSWKRNPFR